MPVIETESGSLVYPSKPQDISGWRVLVPERCNPIQYFGNGREAGLRSSPLATFVSPETMQTGGTLDLPHPVPAGLAIDLRTPITRIRRSFKTIFLCQVSISKIQEAFNRDLTDDLIFRRYFSGRINQSRELRKWCVDLKNVLQPKITF